MPTDVPLSARSLGSATSLSASLSATSLTEPSGTPLLELDIHRAFEAAECRVPPVGAHCCWEPPSLWPRWLCMRCGSFWVRMPLFCSASSPMAPHGGYLGSLILLYIRGPVLLLSNGHGQQA